MSWNDPRLACAPTHCTVRAEFGDRGYCARIIEVAGDSVRIERLASWWPRYGDRCLLEFHLGSERELVTVEAQVVWRSRVQVGLKRVHGDISFAADNAEKDPIVFRPAAFT
jgi:hypothetical protein